MHKSKTSKYKNFFRLQNLLIISFILIFFVSLIGVFNYYSANNYYIRNAKAQEVKPNPGDGGGIGTPGYGVNSSSSSSSVSSSSSISSSRSSSSVSSSISSSVVSSSSSSRSNSNSSSSVNSSGVSQAGLNNSTPSSLQNEGGSGVGVKSGVNVSNTVVSSSRGSASSSFTQVVTPRTGGLQITLAFTALCVLGGVIYYYKAHGNTKSKLAMAEKKIDFKKR